jgi:protocatechuate 3,4-dioxygenase beta subunit
MIRSRVTGFSFEAVTMRNFKDHPRRRLLKGMAASGIMGLFSGLSSSAIAATALAPTPACDDDNEPTRAETEGPYYTPNSPERADFREPGVAGTPILLTGLVISRSCVPLARVLVDLWHADNDGIYDNNGYRCRGHQFTGATGAIASQRLSPDSIPAEPGIFM